MDREILEEFIKGQKSGFRLILQYKGNQFRVYTVKKVEIISDECIIFYDKFGNRTMLSLSDILRVEGGK